MWQCQHRTAPHLHVDLIPSPYCPTSHHTAHPIDYRTAYQHRIASLAPHRTAPHRIYPHGISTPLHHTASRHSTTLTTHITAPHHTPPHRTSPFFRRSARSIRRSSCCRRTCPSRRASRGIGTTIRSGSTSSRETKQARSAKNIYLRTRVLFPVFGSSFFFGNLAPVLQHP